MEEVKKNNKVMFLEIFLIICMCLVTFSGTIEPLVNARTIIYIALLGIAVVLVALNTMAYFIIIFSFWISIYH